jgi:hypothetical protein
MPYLISRCFFRGLLLATLGGAAAACVNAPVQEMSNARQAIRAARDAGADRLAPQKLSEAQAFLERAEVSLQNRSYRDARRNAVEARGRASEALDAVRPGENKESG